MVWCLPLYNLAPATDISALVEIKKKKNAPLYANPARIRLVLFLLLHIRGGPTIAAAENDIRMPILDPGIITVVRRDASTGPVSNLFVTFSRR